jgi:2-dehydro-3-deoxyphosphooctonate aldolase (KDO 8-P synthase)
LKNIAKSIKNLIDGKNIEFFLKSSATKENRTKAKNFRGIGSFFSGLRLLRDVGKEFDLKICTDFHNIEQIQQYSQYVDMVQIPAFLSRQLPLLEAAALSDKIIHVKKMQSMPPDHISIPVNILRNSGAKRIIITDRGTSFGYNQLMFDPRHIPIMKMYTNEVLVDITHINKYYSKWYWEKLDFPFILAKSALAAGTDGLFMEVHTCPSDALCDSTNMLDFIQFGKIVTLL